MSFKILAFFIQNLKMLIENKNIYREINFIYHIELTKNVSKKIAKIVTSFF